jgi:hypothetical protein
MNTYKITASEARKISENSIDENNLNRLKLIEKEINRACSENKFCTYVYSDLSISVINDLKNREFQVENLSSQREGTCFKISW